MAVSINSHTFVSSCKLFLGNSSLCIVGVGSHLSFQILIVFHLRKFFSTYMKNFYQLLASKKEHMGKYLNLNTQYSKEWLLSMSFHLCSARRAWLKTCRSQEPMLSEFLESNTLIWCVYYAPLFITPSEATYHIATFTLYIA